jgi:hypothetical protein
MILHGTLCLAGELMEKYSFIELTKNCFKQIKKIIINSADLIGLSV